MKKKQKQPIDDATKCKGLLVLLNCLNKVIDSVGEKERDKMVRNSKVQIVEAYKRAQKFLPENTIKKRLKISGQRLSRWSTEKICCQSVTKRCLLSCPMQLSIAEQTLIRFYLVDSEFTHLPRNHIWAEAKRRGLCVSAHVFYAYARAICGKKKKFVLEKGATISIHAERPFQILHMDSTLITCTNGDRVWVHFIMDNYSRSILAGVPLFSTQSMDVAYNLKDAIGRYKLYNKPFDLYCDDGPENKGYVTKLLENNKSIMVTKIVAHYKEKTSNNMIEYWNRRFKYIILRYFHPKNYAHLEKILPQMIEYANNLCLPILGTLTPNETRKGMVYEDLNYKESMAVARKLRVIENRGVECVKYCKQE